MYTCSCAQTAKIHQGLSVWKILSPHIESLFRALWSTMTVFIWLHLMAVDIFPLQTDAFWWSECLCLTLSCGPAFKCCFSYSCQQKVVFAASFPCMSTTGILPVFCVCVCVVGVHGCLPLCLHMCEYFSGVEAAFMSVPSVENGSVTEGQPLALHWASHSVPKSQMPLSDVGSLLFVHETTTENT